jgi:hypothetical protein
MPPIKNTWGQRDAEGAVRTLTTPSGSECVAERVGMAGLVKTGTLGEGDSLTDFVDRKHIRRVRGAKGQGDHDKIDIHSLMKDPQALGKVVMLIDRVMPVVVKDPVVRLHFVDLDKPDKDGNETRRLSEEERADVMDAEGECVWTDQIPLEDKMFLFNWSVGGSADAERFLAETSGAVAGVEHGSGVPVPAKRTPRSKR